jgi:hypothetical protein
MLQYSQRVKSPVISKSRYVAGLQCPKLLWHYFNQPDIFPPVDAATQAIFGQGVQVGELAKQLFPKGIEIGAGMIKKDAVNELSCAAVSRRLPMFEAGFVAGCAYARADVLVPVGREQWDIVEVKSTTKTKAEHVSDLALQRHVYEGVGLGIRRCFVMHLNSAYVRRGEIDPSELFTKTDVTGDVDDVVGDVGSELKKMVRIIGQQRSPDADIGLQCSDPYDCPLQPMCWKAVPKHSVLTLALRQQRLTGRCAKGGGIRQRCDHSRGDAGSQRNPAGRAAHDAGRCLCRARRLRGYGFKGHLPKWGRSAAVRAAV